MADKKTIRLELQQQRQQLSKLLREQWSAAICRHLEKWLSSQQVQVILGFRSFGDEVAINRWLDTLSERYQIGLPVAMRGGQMEFYRYRCGDPLIANRWGIEEPLPQPQGLIIPEKAVILVPALAVSSEGHRLGYGGGFYDRFLARYPDLMKVGVIYERFANSTLPIEAHDRPLNLVCHQHGLIKF